MVLRCANNILSIAIVPQKFPSVFTRTSGYKEWISKSICSLSNFPPASCDGPATTNNPIPTPAIIPSPIPAATNRPTRAPITRRPSHAPTRAPITRKPSRAPTKSPVTRAPVTDQPVRAPATRTPVTYPPVQARVTASPVRRPETRSPSQAQVTNKPTMKSAVDMELPTVEPFRNSTGMPSNVIMDANVRTDTPVTPTTIDSSTGSPEANATSDSPSIAIMAYYGTAMLCLLAVLGSY